jgi:LmbE family N-acetylglucosaminyl deacetylase
VWLDFQDAVYRRSDDRWLYTSLTGVFGPIHAEEEARPEAIAAAVRRVAAPGAGATLYAPLTVGGHVDHRHAHRAARLLRAQGWRVVFYEDYPYADPAYRLPFGEENKATLAVTLEALAARNLAPRVLRLSEDDMQARIDSVRVYRSQVPLLFGDEASMAERLRAYAVQVGGEGPAERFWVPG